MDAPTKMVWVGKGRGSKYVSEADIIAAGYLPEDEKFQELLIDQARLIDAIWKLAEDGVPGPVLQHTCHGTLTCQKIVDKIKAVMLTGEKTKETKC